MNNSLVLSVGALSACLTLLPGWPGVSGSLMAKATTDDARVAAAEPAPPPTWMTHMVGLKVQPKARAFEEEDACPIDATSSRTSTARWQGRSGSPTAMLGRLD